MLHFLIKVGIRLQSLYLVTDEFYFIIIVWAPCGSHTAIISTLLEKATDFRM